MTKKLTAALAAALFGAFTLPVLAQTDPADPESCKPGEQWDSETKTCKPTE